MTAFAGSIGIIGIAAILALANGVNNYIANVKKKRFPNILCKFRVRALT